MIYLDRFTLPGLSTEYITDGGRANAEFPSQGPLCLGAKGIPVPDLSYGCLRQPGSRVICATPAPVLAFRQPCRDRIRPRLAQCNQADILERDPVPVRNRLLRLTRSCPAPNIEDLLLSELRQTMTLAAVVLPIAQSIRTGILLPCSPAQVFQARVELSSRTVTSFPAFRPRANERLQDEPVDSYVPDGILPAKVHERITPGTCANLRFQNISAPDSASCPARQRSHVTQVRHFIQPVVPRHGAPVFGHAFKVLRDGGT